MLDKFESLRQGVQDARVRAHLNSNNGMSSPYVTVKLVPGPAGAVAVTKVRSEQSLLTSSNTLQFEMY